jgi:pimeloyl-ACP methyl ester carboxylesterase
LAQTILAFTDALGLARYALYVFDYGAPTGFRLAMTRPERINAIVSQNGNAYEEGLGNHGLPFGATGTSLLLRTAKQSAKS